MKVSLNHVAICVIAVFLIGRFMVSYFLLFPISRASVSSLNTLLLYSFYLTLDRTSFEIDFFLNKCMNL